MPGGGLDYAYGRSVLPLPQLGHGACQLVRGGSELLDIMRVYLSAKVIKMNNFGISFPFLLE